MIIFAVMVLISICLYVFSYSQKHKAGEEMAFTMVQIWLAALCVVLTLGDKA